MKRSDMVKLIWDFVQTAESDYDIYMSKLDCDSLLQEMEESGMLPPQVASSVTTKTFKDEIIYSAVEFHSKWEPEND